MSRYASEFALNHFCFLGPVGFGVLGMAGIQLVARDLDHFDCGLETSNSRLDCWRPGKVESKMGGL